MPEGYKTSRMEMARTGTRVKTGKESDAEHIIPTEIHLPDIQSTAFGYLLGYFFASGQVMQTGMGLAPLTWQEIKAFNEVNDLYLCSWEMQILRKMSEVYCSEYAQATDPKRPCPYVPENMEEKDEGLAKAMQIRNALKAFRGQKG